MARTSVLDQGLKEVAGVVSARNFIGAEHSLACRPATDHGLLIDFM